MASGAGARRGSQKATRRAPKRKHREPSWGRHPFAKAAAGVVAAPSPPAWWPAGIKRMVKQFAAALARSRSTGQPVRLIVDVAPSGLAQIATAGSVAALAEGSALESSLGRARERGRARVAEILNGQEMLSADQLAERLGTSRMTVNARRQKNQLLALQGAKRGFRFPEWQIGEDGKPFGILPTLFERLGGSAWAVYRFLVQHHPELDGMTAREALRDGRTEDVLEAVESAGRDFA
jgi:hypothetical protein